MSPHLRYGIIENLDTVPRIPSGQFWRVAVLVTPLAWLSPCIFFGLHVLLNALNDQLSLADRLQQALLFMIAVEITTALHAFGHILSGKLVHSAMDALLITATRDVNLYYGDQRLVPGQIHLVRALGGPLLNLFAAGVCAILAVLIPAGFWLVLVHSLISTNLFFGVGGLLPVPSVDGEVIWRELLRLMDSHAGMKNVSTESTWDTSQPQTSRDND
jgi:Zn-dependent protease